MPVESLAKDQMALNLLRGRSNSSALAAADTFEIGAVDRDVFSCPVCSRPLQVGMSRCFGCGTRLVLGVPTQRAALFLSIGTALGLLAGTTGALAFATVTRPNTVQVQAPAAVVPASSGPGPSAGASAAPPRAPAVSAIVRSSISATAEIDNRLAIAAGALHAELHRADPRPKSIAATLRAISSDVARGSELAAGMATWTGAAPVAQDLTKFYRGIRDIAKAGLKASTSNAPAYRNAGSAMVQALADIPAVDTKLRLAAEKAGVKVPPFFWVVAQAPGG